MALLQYWNIENHVIQMMSNSEKSIFLIIFLFDLES